MVKDFFRGFGYTIGKIVAFFFIAFLIMFLFTNLDDFDIKKIPFKQLIMKVMFVNSYALDRTYVLYVCDFNNSSCSRYITLNDGQIDNGVAITHTSGSYPNAQTFFLGSTTWENQKRYIINIDYTIKSASPLTYSSKFNHINTMFDTSSRIGTTEYTLLSSSVNSGIYTYHYSIRSDVTFPRTVSSLALHSNFSTNTRITYIKVNSWSVTQVTNDNTDIINNNNQNTTNIINNNNQNTQEIINSQNETTDAINDLNDTLTDTTQPNTSNFFNNLDNYVPSMTPITDLINMPYNLINRYLSGLDGTCSPINLGSLYGTNLTLPCIDLEAILGSQLWGIIDILFVGMMCLSIGELLIHDFNSLLTLNDEFEETYTPRHAKRGAN